MRRATVVFLAAFAFLALPSSASAMDAGKFGLGFGGTFNLTSTTNELTTGESIDNSTLFVRLNPRAEYFVTDNVPITFRAGLLSRSLDRGETNATELDALVTIGSGYHLRFNDKVSLIFETELGGYIGSSESSIVVNDVAIEASTDTRGFAFGAALDFAYLFNGHSQLRAGVAFTGLIGNESVQNSSETLGAQTYTMGLALRYMYFF